MYVYWLLLILFSLSYGCGKTAIDIRSIENNNNEDVVVNYLSILSARTIDSDADGKLDHYEVTFDEAIDDSTFPGYAGSASIGGAQTAFAVAGRSNVVIDPTVSSDVDDDATIYLLFDEVAYGDTGETPEITTSSGSGLTALSSDAVLGTLSAGDISETDNANPVIMYAKAQKLQNTFRVYFSEPVYANVGAVGNLTASDFTFTNVGGGDASGIDSIIDADASDKVVVLKASGGSHGYFQSVDLGSDTIRCATMGAASVYDAQDLPMSPVSATAISKITGPDFNGDGLDDLVFGVSSLNSNAGRIWLYYGGLNGNQNLSDADVVIEGSAASTYLGSAKTFGDINNDGLDDLLLTSISSNGAVYIFYGGSFASSSMNESNANAVLIGTAGEVNGGIFSQGGLVAEDYNNDGIDDILVANMGNNTGAMGNYGRVYLFWGGALGASTNDSAADVMIDGTENIAVPIGLGYGINNVQDINDDGNNDFVLASPYHSGGGTSRGRLFFFFGKGTSGSWAATYNDTNANATISGSTNSQLLGISSTQTLGGHDFNNDNVSDYVVKIASSYGAGIFYGDATFGGALVSTGHNVLFSATPNARFSIYDINNDGADDMSGGNGLTDGAGCGGTWCGTSYVWYGGAFAATENVASADVVVEGTENNAFLDDPYPIGDVNNDGVTDVIFCSQGGGSNNGMGYIFYGGTLAASEDDTSADIIITGDANTNFCQPIF